MHEHFIFIRVPKTPCKKWEGNINNNLEAYFTIPNDLRYLSLWCEKKIWKPVYSWHYKISWQPPIYIHWLLRVTILKQCVCHNFNIFNYSVNLQWIQHIVWDIVKFIRIIYSLWASVFFNQQIRSLVTKNTFGS